MPNGVKTTAIARSLIVELEPHDLDVLYGHGDKGIDAKGNLGKLRAWFSHDYKDTTILADLDIAIVSRSNDWLIALIEIEESPVRPKQLLGDALAPLFCDHVTFQGRRHLLVGPWTTLIVLANTPTAHQSRTSYLEKQVNQMKAVLGTANATVGRVVIDGFQDELALGQKLRIHIQAAVADSRGATQP